MIPNAKITCAICGTVDAAFTWTDTTGIGKCTTCGTPHQFIGYSKDGIPKALDVPKFCVDKSFLRAFQEYWKVTKSKIPDFYSFTGDSAAREEEQNKFQQWIENFKGGIANE